MISLAVQSALLATARLPAEAGRAALASTLSKLDESDWRALIEHALAHGTAALLCRHLLGIGSESLPADVAAACEAYLAARQGVAGEAMAQLGLVIDTLTAAGIDTVPFKGPVLALQAYGDAAMRDYRDLDILVRRRQVPGTLAALDRLGYRSDAVIGLRARRIADYHRYNGHDILFAPGKLPLEPHWALSPRTFAVELDGDPIFGRAVQIEAATGRRYACFAPEDALLAAATHAAKEQWARLGWVADIAALLQTHPALDWAAALARATPAGCRRMTLLAAALAGELLDAPLPRQVRDAIGRDRAVATLVERVRARLFAPKTTVSVFTLTRFRWDMREGFANRLRYAARTLFTARVPHFRTVDLPDRLSFLYPAVRLGRDYLVLPVWRALNRHGGNAGAADDDAAAPVAPDPLATPDFFPMRIDTNRNTVLFVQMSRESFRQSAFLDRRAIFAGETTLLADVATLLRRPAERPTHFILHGAFCGSTLLTRYLEQLPCCFVLKEPGVLGQLTGLRNTMPDADRSAAWHDWFRATMSLLARGYPTDSAVIIKPADMCNWMGSLLLDHDPITKVIFLQMPLRIFLLQILRTEDRRQWLRRHMQPLRRPMAGVPFLAAVAGAELTDGQSGAAMWLLNSYLCGSLLARSDSHRVLALNGEDVIGQPQQSVLAVADFLGLTGEAANRTALETLRPSAQHAKDNRIPFDAAAHASRLGEAEVRYGEEMRSALSWASTVSAGWLAESPFPIT